MESLRVWSGALIIAGTSIGAGMLGLPVASGACGIIIASLVLVLCWGFMCMTGLLYAELACSYRENINITTMASRTLGKFGKPIVLLVYLFFFYALTVAYFVGGGHILTAWLAPTWLPQVSRVVLFALLFVPVVWIGQRIVAPLNKLLIIGLLCAYLGFVFVGIHIIQPDNFLFSQLNQAPFVFPLAFASFGYQGTVPTLASWMNYDRGSVRCAIVRGTLLTLAVYIVWLLLILGIVPYEGVHGLKQVLASGGDAVQPLEYFTQDQHVLVLGRMFAFFAIATSFLGVGVGLMDFLRDALGVNSKNAITKGALLLGSFGVPFMFALIYPNVFLEALGYAGGFGSAFLLGILPIIMVYRAKYVHNAPRVGYDINRSLNDLYIDAWYTKKSVLFSLFIFVIFEIICECLHLFALN